jgi:tetratricopeptide (TPR) repeat protein
MHRQYREAIQELIDGTLGGIRKAELQLHLEQCDDCRAFAADLQRIRDLAGSLDRPAPPDGVWLQIAGRLRQEGRVQQAEAAPARSRQHYALLAIAAGLLVAISASLYVLYPRFSETNPAQSAAAQADDHGNAAGADAVQSVENEFRLAEQHYQNAISKLDEAFKSDRDAIDPQTAATLQKNLQLIDQAIAESRAALKTEPQSVPARDSLFDALRRKVSLLQDTIALMNEMRKGDSAGAAMVVEGMNKS